MSATSNQPSQAKHTSDNGGSPLPPHNLGAEEAVLGAILKSPSSIGCIAGALAPDAFFDPRHRHIYAVMLDLHRERQPIDYTTLDDRLQRARLSDVAGSALYLSQINLSTPSAAHIEHYASIVQRTATARAVISHAQHVTELAYRDTFEPELLEHATALTRVLAPAAEAPSYPEPENRGRAVLSALGELEYAEDLVRPGRILVVAATEGSARARVDSELGIRLAIAGGTFAETWPVRQREAC